MMYIEVAQRGFTVVWEQRRTEKCGQQYTVLLEHQWTPTSCATQWL